MVEVTQEDRILLTEIVRRLDRESYDKDALEHVRRMLATHRIAAHRAGMREAAGIAELVAGQLVEYSIEGCCTLDATFLGTDEGWYRLKFADDSEATVRPSRVFAKDSSHD